jgi:hypothetical protein
VSAWVLHEPDPVLSYSKRGVAWFDDAATLSPTAGSVAPMMTTVATTVTRRNLTRVL